MPQKAIPAGFGAAVLGLFLGALFGTYGAWTPVFFLATPGVSRWALAITLGIIFAFIYDYVQKSLPGKTGIQKGAAFGLLVWIVTLILGAIFVFFRDAVYASGTVLFLAALLHLVWGGTLGYLYEQKL